MHYCYSGDRTVVKLCDKEVLLKEREQKLLVNSSLQKILHLETFFKKILNINIKAAQRKAADELKRQQELNEAKVGAIL